MEGSTAAAGTRRTASRPAASGADPMRPSTSEAICSSPECTALATVPSASTTTALGVALTAKLSLTS